MKDLLLKEYNPVSQCIVKSTLLHRAKFKAIDIHEHLGKLVLGDDYKNTYDLDLFKQDLDALNIQRIINLDGVWGSEFVGMVEHTKKYNDLITTFVWIDVSRIDESDFKETTRKHLVESYNKGARGIKMWKVISLNQKDKSSKYIRTDDDRLQVVYETAALLDIPVLIHIADPVAFFLPIDERNERYEELVENPDWSFISEDKYSFNELMDMQDNMIEKNPNTNFIVAHFGSYAENLAHVASRLDRYPNMYVDMAARIAELGRTPYTSRDFFIKYSDRILYGTDCTPLNLKSHEKYFRFLETYDEYFEYQEDDEMPGQGRWKIYGIGLPDDVLRNVYYRNACKLLRLNEADYA